MQKIESKRERGFTLIELMIVVAIVAVLVAIVLPQYRQFTFKTRRVEGIGYLQGLHKAELAYFAIHSAFPVMNHVGIPPHLGFTLSQPPKFYSVPGWPGSELGTWNGGNSLGYVAELVGSIDDIPSDQEILGIYYPDSNWNLWGVPKPPGEVVILLDDIRKCFPDFDC